MKRMVAVLGVVGLLLGLLTMGCAKKDNEEGPAAGGVGKPETQKKMGDVYQKTQEKK